MRNIDGLASPRQATNNNMEAAVEVRNVSVHFGDRSILSGLSFSVAKGDSLAVIGPNGSGKTVLLKALIGSIPFSGTVTWAPGTRIGYVPQKLDLERDIPITGIDFLRAHIAVSHKPTLSISAALNSVGIPREVAGQPIGTLSGGQFQRLLIAFALVGDPNLLLLDEPTTGVDEAGQERLNELVRRLQQDHGLTAIFISHELSVVYQYAKNVLCLGGAQAWFGPPQTILTHELLTELYGSELNYHVHEH